MLETLLDVKRRAAGMRGLLLLSLGIAVAMVWLFGRSASHLDDYTEVRKQTWISPERIAYVNKLETSVQAIEGESTELITTLATGSANTKASRDAQIVEVRQHARTVRERLSAVKAATNDELEAAKAELEKTLEAAQRAVATAKTLVEAPPPSPAAQPAAQPTTP